MSQKIYIYSVWKLMSSINEMGDNESNINSFDEKNSNKSSNSHSAVLPDHRISSNTAVMALSANQESINSTIHETNPREIYDGKNVQSENMLFDDATIRRGFIRKVYSILMCQLILTIMIITAFIWDASTMESARKHSEFFWVFLSLAFALLLFIICCPNVRRKSPMNYICLLMFTIAEGCVVGYVAALKNSREAVLIAAGLTVIVCFSLTVFAFQTKWDFTRLNSFLFIALILLLILGFVAIFSRNHILHFLYSAGGVLLFSLYLVHDTQLMMGGKHKYSISPEEYIFGALNLYTDIVRIFLHLLSIRI